ncbi:MAG: purine-nucleoside phosphorylase [Acidobacteria bacterium]|nr:purine-nucleoside phosphorylase [Acidobacteriota bacterium]
MPDAIDFLRSRISATPQVAVVLGSGLGGFAHELDSPVTIPYSDIPGWPPSTAVGHAGKLVFGKIGGVDAVVMAGRAHLYEGYTQQQVTFGVRALAQLGVRSIVLTNAAGGINVSYSPGSLVLISDHINLQGSNPLVGPNDDALGPRFPDMSEAYCRACRTAAHEEAQRLGIELAEGVYAGLLGPTYETPAEIRYLRAIGADLVGMSTVGEVIVANHMGLRCLGISTVTNMAAGVTEGKINHEDVLDIGRAVRAKLTDLLKATIPRLAA